MERFEDRAALSYGESEQWSEQAAAVRSDAQAIERDLSQPFFAWLAEREGSGRPPDRRGRRHAPGVAPDPGGRRGAAGARGGGSSPSGSRHRPGPTRRPFAGRAEYEAERAGFGETHGPAAAAAAHAGWAGDVREPRRLSAGAPEAGEVGAKAGTHRAAAEGDLAQRGTVRATRTELVEDAVRDGRAVVAAEHDRSVPRARDRGRPVRRRPAGGGSSTERPGTPFAGAHRSSRPARARHRAGPARTGSGP